MVEEKGEGRGGRDSRGTGEIMEIEEMHLCNLTQTSRVRRCFTGTRLVTDLQWSSEQLIQEGLVVAMVTTKKLHQCRQLLESLVDTHTILKEEEEEEEQDDTEQDHPHL